MRRLSILWKSAAVCAIAATTAASCTAPVAGPAERQSAPAAQLAPGEIPTTEAVEFPTATASAATTEASPPSQSLDDADRDGVSPAVAELSMTERVTVIDDVAVSDGLWVASRLQTAAIEDVFSRATRSFAVTPTEGELLHITSGQIERAVPIPSGPPQFVFANEQFVVAGRAGDGGYPDGALVLIDITSGDTTKLVIPFGYELAATRSTGRGWELAAPAHLGTLNALIATAVRVTDDSEPKPVFVDDLATAITQAKTVDAERLPAISSPTSGCDTTGWTSGAFYQIDGRCVFQQGGPADPANATTSAGDIEIAGTLVGVGRFGLTQPTYAAIVRESSPSAVAAPLLFIDIDDPQRLVDTGIVGRDEGTQVTNVGFFGAGFVVTRAVDQTTQVTVYDTSFEPVDAFASPTDSDRGYPPDPAITFAELSTDGSTMIWAERAWPSDGSFEPGRQAAVVVADATTGVEIRRIEFELERVDYLTMMDVHNGWAVLSFKRFDLDAAVDIPPPLPILIDTDTGEVYPLGLTETATIRRW